MLMNEGGRTVGIILVEEAGLCPKEQSCPSALGEIASGRMDDC
jgi:hypothetical protein